MEASWKEVSGQKTNKNSSEMSMPRKQPKMNRFFQPSKSVPTTDSFERLEEKHDDASINVKGERWER
jgi:phage shock protein A